MPLTLTQIIAEADVRVPNMFDAAQKVNWLNEINNEFFDAVKIPVVTTFTSNGSGAYPMPSSVQSKNVDLVMIGTQFYTSMQYDIPLPGRNYWNLNDSNNSLAVVPDSIAGDAGIVRYYQKPVTTFLASALTAAPDAPAEYHWLYILGLCERIGKAMDDVGKANNYANDYRNGLLLAQQSFAKRGG